MPDRLTRQQIFELRGRLKAPQRAVAMRKRHNQWRSKVVQQYQEQLAKDILRHI